MSWETVESNCFATVMKLEQPMASSSPSSPPPPPSSSSPPSSSPSPPTATGTTKRVRKFVLNLPSDLKDKLKRWMGCSRLTYNRALESIKTGKAHRTTLSWLQKRFVTACNIPGGLHFLLECPQAIRAGAIKDLERAYKTNFAKRKKNPAHRFEIHFRSKKDDQSIIIPKTAFKQVGDGVAMYPKLFSDRAILPSHLMPQADCRLTLDATGRFVLHIPADVPKHSMSDNQAQRACAVDPGVRTFMTTWSPQGQAFKLGDGDATHLYSLLLVMDKLIARISAANKRSKWRKKRALARLRQRFDNLQRDLHYQCANFLVRRYGTVVIPPFGVKGMTSKTDRRLRTKTVRSMLGLAHYKFRQRLKEVAERRGVRVVECTEEYTSKTCSRCGWIHPNLGGRKVFVCGECGLKIDRDLQGAFNIFLKHSRSEAH